MIEAETAGTEIAPAPAPETGAENAAEPAEAEAKGAKRGWWQRTFGD